MCIKLAATEYERIEVAREYSEVHHRKMSKSDALDDMLIANDA